MLLTPEMFETRIPIIQLDDYVLMATGHCKAIHKVYSYRKETLLVHSYREYDFRIMEQRFSIDTFRAAFSFSDHKTNAIVLSPDDFEFVKGFSW